MAYVDRTLACQDCGNEFQFTAGEQEFFASKEFSEPRRCPACRRSRRGQRSEEGGGRSYHPVVCARCGVNTEVPFLPRGDRPVYCESCYTQVRAAAPGRGFER